MRRGATPGGGPCTRRPWRRPHAAASRTDAACGSGCARGESARGGARGRAAARVSPAASPGAVRCRSCSTPGRRATQPSSPRVAPAIGALHVGMLALPAWRSTREGGSRARLRWRRRRRRRRRVPSCAARRRRPTLVYQRHLRPRPTTHATPTEFASEQPARPHRASGPPRPLRSRAIATARGAAHPRWLRGWAASGCSGGGRSARRSTRAAGDRPQHAS